MLPAKGKVTLMFAGFSGIIVVVGILAIIGTTCYATKKGRNFNLDLSLADCCCDQVGNKRKPPSGSDLPLETPYGAPLQVFTVMFLFQNHTV